MIARIKPLHKLARMYMYNSGFLFYRKLYKEKNYNLIFDDLKDKEKGERS